MELLNVSLYNKRNDSAAKFRFNSLDQFHQNEIEREREKDRKTDRKAVKIFWKYECILFQMSILQNRYLP